MCYYDSEVPCSCGRVNIGEIKRTLKTRIKEHQAVACPGQLEKSAATEMHGKMDMSLTGVVYIFCMEPPGTQYY